MNRRRFLSTTALSGLGLLSLSGAAKAFTLHECDSAPGSDACQTIARHDAILLKLDNMLQEQGIGETERKSILASALCPFCGMPLLPS